MRSKAAITGLFYVRCTVPRNGTSHARVGRVLYSCSPPFRLPYNEYASFFGYREVGNSVISKRCLLEAIPSPGRQLGNTVMEIPTRWILLLSIPMDQSGPGPFNSMCSSWKHAVGLLAVQYIYKFWDAHTPERIIPGAPFSTLYHAPWRPSTGSPLRRQFGR